ncbi:transcriptional regulator, LysR family protein [Roseobacter sp. SK209-2-6]|uniref:LysR substrate-binding domain-containing protein n=1 Tax=Roseobacter sp. SK209-2-6 TaxID=388739 RepID=UPI0000F3F61F|nr:LysR substrate-binding domain-containing protein [Roseobacter sp. SK209-2-6]EBA18072.1 transcriptional regulator, LysR family protein [Roseobacter sp. SK209-2-6]
MLETPDLKFFLAIAQASSLAAAARSLNVTPPAVSQRLALIEERIGLRLVERGRRSLTLTTEGEALARKSSRILGQLAELNEDLAARRGDVAGPLTVIAPFGFGRLHVAPVMNALLKEHPGIVLDLILSDDPYGAGAKESWDIIVHIGQLKDLSAIQRKLCSNRRYLVASPDYLARCGAPELPEDLPEFSCGVIREDQADVTMWHFAGPDGKGHSVRVTPDFASNDGEVVKSWALAGQGIVLRSEWNVSQELEEGSLVRVLADYSLPEADIVALLSPKTLRSERVNLAMDWLCKAVPG